MELLLLTLNSVKVKTNVLISTLFFTFLALFASCYTPICENTNPIFNSNSFESEEYKIKLSEEIITRGDDKLNYYLDSYAEKNNLEYLIINIEF